MILKYDIFIEPKILNTRLKKILNQIYKLLPSREQGVDWEKPLETILQQLSGMQRLINENCPYDFFILLNKLQGLYCLKQEKDFSLYRRTIFECLNLINEIRGKICLDQKV